MRLLHVWAAACLNSPGGLTVLVPTVSHLDFPFYFVLTGQILGVSGNERSVVFLGGTGLVSGNVSVKL